MGVDNLYKKEARKKIEELAESIDYCMLATNLKKQPIHSIPMSTKEVDGSGSIWFLSGADSEHNQNIEKDNKVQLTYAHPGDMEFMNIYGTAEIITDRRILEKLYGKSDDAWFDGLDDPNLTAIKVEVEDAFYWEPKSNKLISLFKMGVGAITGNQPDMGDEGKLKV